MTSTSVSPQLASTYRLFLRGISASVLHYGPAKRTLRKLYRQTFSEARQVEKRLAINISTTKKGDSQSREELDKWLLRWNQQIDNTLYLLYSSATNRGLAHRVTRNLGRLTYAHLQEPQQRPVWDPKAPPKLKPPKKLSKKQESKVSFDAMAFRALGEAVRLAEGHGNLTLGTLPPRRWLS